MIGFSQIVLSEENDRCQAKKVLEGMAQEKEILKKQRTKIKTWAKENLIGKIVKHSEIDGDIQFTVTGIKEALNQPHKHIIAKNEAIKTILSRIKKGTYIGKDKDIKGRDIEYHYIRTTINGEDSFITIKDEWGVKSFYSITDKKKSK